MLFHDTAFNLTLLLVDAALGTYFFSIRQRPRPFVPVFFGLIALMAGGLAWAVCLTAINSLRLFATFRFFGHTIFFHLPAMLVFAAFVFRGDRPLRWTSLIVAAALFAVYVDAYHIEPYRLEVTHYEYTHPLLAGLERPVTIAQVADIQTDRVGRYERRVLKELHDLKPDIILNCGDYAQCNTVEDYDLVHQELRKEFLAAELDPPLGSYAIRGDFDSLRIKQHFYDRQDIQFLENERIEIELPGVRMNLIGLSLHSSFGAKQNEWKPLFTGRDKTLPTILLGHAPDFVDKITDYGEPFLAIAGHTHGGQVQIPFIGPLLTFSKLPTRYADGFLPYGPGTLSVSRGIGMEREDAPRLRFFCRPEIRVITLMPPEAG